QSLAYALDRDVLDEDVGSRNGNASYALREQGGVEEGDRAAVAVAIEYGFFFCQVQSVQQGRKGVLRLNVQVVQPADFIQGTWRAAAIAVPRINQAATIRRVAYLLGPVAPHGNRPQTFVQKNQQWPLLQLRRKQLIFNLDLPA